MIFPDSVERIKSTLVEVYRDPFWTGVQLPSSPPIKRTGSPCLLYWYDEYGEEHHFGVKVCENIKLFAGHMSRRESRLTRGIGFQDSCDVFLLAMMPNCWEFKADL